MLSQPITLVPYARRYRRNLLNLVQEAEDEGYLHLHLDWSTVEDWISDPDVLIHLAWSGPTLIGAVAASPPQGQTAWLRLIAIRDADIAPILGALWDSIRAALLAAGVHEIGVLTLRPWLEPYLEPLGFRLSDQIVTLRRNGLHIPDSHVTRNGVAVRHIGWRDVPHVMPVDHAAFEPMWQLNLSAFREAAREASSFTLAEAGGNLLGYQLSTVYRDGGHLARLAVIPGAQGNGIGGLLVGSMLDEFARRGVISVTVNTQQTNQRSQRLYQRYDFRLTGASTPMWLWKSIDHR